MELTLVDLNDRKYTITHKNIKKFIIRDGIMIIEREDDTIERPVHTLVSCVQ